MIIGVLNKIIKYIFKFVVQKYGWNTAINTDVYIYYFFFCCLWPIKALSGELSDFLLKTFETLNPTLRTTSFTVLVYSFITLGTQLIYHVTNTPPLV